MLFTYYYTLFRILNDYMLSRVVRRILPYVNGEYSSELRQFESSFTSELNICK